jgi:hypothetical protein
VVDIPQQVVDILKNPDDIHTIPVDIGFLPQLGYKRECNFHKMDKKSRTFLEEIP